MSSDLKLVIDKLNDSQVQSRVIRAAREAIVAQLAKEDIDLTPELLAELAAMRATSRDSDADEILAAGAVLISVIGLFSDIRLKANLEWTGLSASGIRVYEFSYKGFSSRWRGVLADELLVTHPEAVSRHTNGFLTVDYDKVDVRFRKVVN